jgi:hypothetical protein
MGVKKFFNVLVLGRKTDRTNLNSVGGDARAEMKKAGVHFPASVIQTAIFSLWQLK